MAELSKLEEEVKAIYDTKVKAYKVLNIFNEYFGEELVDSQIKSYESCLEDIYSYTSINNLLNTYYNITNHNDEVKIGLGNRSVTMTKEDFDNIKDLSIKDNFPDVLLPIINIVCNSMVSFSSDIIVRFPNITITNENDKSVDIQEFYVKVTVDNRGKLLSRFKCIRAFFYTDQWESDYCHSHLPRISKEWEEPCTGTGPINTTMSYLMDSYSSFSEEMWGLFCYELDKFVRVESLAGVPYKRLESIGLIENYPISANTSHYGAQTFTSILTTPQCRAFTNRIVNNVPIKAAFNKGRYVLGESFINIWIKISREFAKWYNEMYSSKKLDISLDKLMENNIIFQYVHRDGNIYRTKSTIYRSLRRSRSEYEGYTILVFKGEPVKFHIEDAEEDKRNYVYLLSPNIVWSFINRVLLILNYNYGREETTTEEDQTTNKGRVIYI